MTSATEIISIALVQHRTGPFCPFTLAPSVTPLGTPGDDSYKEP